MVLLELVELGAVHLEVDRGAVLGVGWLQLRVHTVDAPAVAFEDRILEQEAESGHLWDEHLPGAVHLCITSKTRSTRDRQVCMGKPSETSANGPRRTSSMRCAGVPVRHERTRAAIILR